MGGKFTQKFTQKLTWVDVLQVPAEAFAFQVLSKFFSGTRVTAIHPQRDRVHGEVEVLPLVQPDIGDSGVVVVHDLRRATRESVGRRFSEHVTDVRAGDDLGREE